MIKLINGTFTLPVILIPKCVLHEVLHEVGENTGYDATVRQTMLRNNITY
jgi:hypothetical protein